jgi:hypothetical protein
MSSWERGGEGGNARAAPARLARAAARDAGEMGDGEGVEERGERRGEDRVW